MTLTDAEIYSFRNEQDAALWRAGLDKKLERVALAVETLSSDMRVMGLRVTTLESKPKETRGILNLGVNGCSSLSFAVSALASLFSVLVAVAAVIVAIIALNHP